MVLFDLTIKFWMIRMGTGLAGLKIEMIDYMTLAQRKTNTTSGVDHIH